MEHKHIQRNIDAALKILEALSWKVSKQIHSCTRVPGHESALNLARGRGDSAPMNSYSLK